MTRFLQILILIGLVLGAAWYVLRSLRPPPEDPDKRLRTQVVERADLVRDVRIIGTVAPVLLTQVKSEVGGRVVGVMVENGDKVTAGQPLFELDRKELVSEIEELKRAMTSTRLRMERAERDYQRIEKLRAQDFSTEQEQLDARTEFALVENELSIQEARLATAEEKLSKTRILAPHDGVVLNLDITPGRVIVGANSFSQGDVPMEVADLSRLRIEAKVNEVDLAALTLGQEALVSFASLPGVEARATITNISPSAEKPQQGRGGWGQPENVLFPIRLEFAAPDTRVKPGISALARIEATRVENALVAPVSAIFHDREEGTFVFRQASAGWEKQAVQVGLNSLDKVQVLEGLAEGEIVALGLPAAFDPRFTSADDAI
jgi:membrane fusion protein, macrolide-specific efflux system